MTEVAKAKKEGTVTTAGENPFAASNFLRQFRDKDSRELQQLSAAQFMKVWEHYDDDGKDNIINEKIEIFLKKWLESIIHSLLFIICLKMSLSPPLRSMQIKFYLLKILVVNTVGQTTSNLSLADNSDNNSYYNKIPIHFCQYNSIEK